MPDRDPVRDFARFMERAEAKINLDEGALLIARTDYPELDTAAQLRRLDRLAADVPADPADPPLRNIQALNGVLFDKEKFSGNEEEYDDPRNSYLNDVLDRKKGIPITLSLVYTEVARRRALPLVGVGFPGHFLVKYLAGSGEILIDPYNRGAILSHEDCAERLKAHFGEEADLLPEYFAASSPKQTLARMLNNLKGSYFRRRDYLKVLVMIELALAIAPGSRQDVYDRGMVYFLMKRYRDAMADFNDYLRLTPPDDPQAQEVRQAIHRIRGMMN
jgi:regulator of sirC expression with transglutaminase-like and TPR domain